VIPQRNLSALSNRLLREQGGRRIPEAVLERDYCLSWVLIGLSKTRLSEWLAFKGGTALKKVYFPGYRFSEDLDFTLREETPWEAIQEEWGRLARWVREQVGVGADFQERDPNSHTNTHTFYIGLQGPIPRANPDRLKVDITIRELMCQQIDQRALLLEYDEYEDLEEAPIPVYRIDEIAVEKLMALLDRARNEPRDLYDLWYLSTEDGIHWPELADCLARKYRFREIDPASIVDAYDSKRARLERLWATRLEQQMANLPRFDVVYRELRRALQPRDLMQTVVEHLARL
jgi:predicted nucleotidyltransferase component of viral defense system